MNPGALLNGTVNQLAYDFGYSVWDATSIDVGWYDRRTYR